MNFNAGIKNHILPLTDIASCDEQAGFWSAVVAQRLCVSKIFPRSWIQIPPSTLTLSIVHLLTGSSRSETQFMECLAFQLTGNKNIKAHSTVS